MVGSVLMQRMLEERDFDHLEPTFFTTSQVGGKGPAIGRDTPPLKDATDVKALAALDAIVTCQGGDYSNDVLPKLRSAGWTGYWIDAASALRMKDDAVIVLDPVNREVIDAALKSGIRNYIGGNCTVTLMMMALAGLFRRDVVEWMTCMTYQSASGAGAQNMRELLSQMGEAHKVARELLEDPQSAILDIDREVGGDPARPELSHRALRRAARRQPHPVDRQGHGRRPLPRGVERRRRDEQDPGPRSGHGQADDSGGFDLRTRLARCAATARRSRSS
jgi:aspartate-semialdehyde dehydrogenase